MVEACSHVRLVPAMLALVVLGFAPGAARGQPAQATSDITATTDAVRVVVAGSEPFVMGADRGELSGLSLDVWRAAAAELGLRYEIRRAASASEALGEVIAGRADVAVGPISITAERAQKVGFTQPYFHSSLGIRANPRPALATASGWRWSP